MFVLNSFIFGCFHAGPEYGSMVAAWKGVLNEAERISQIHSTIKDNLCANEIQQVKTFQKDNYRKVQFFDSLLCSEPIDFNSTYIFYSN